MTKRIERLYRTEIKKPYIQKNVKVCKANIKKFLRPEWHREFRVIHIGTIKRALIAGKHPSENITVNQTTGGNYRIINGNHRIEAVRQVIKAYPTFCINLTCTVYNNLNKNKEIEIYEKVNNTRRESGLDKLKAHLIGKKIYNLIEKKFPFKVLFRGVSQSDRNSMSAGNLFVGYIYRNDKTISAGIQNILERVEKLDESDYKRLCLFAKFFKRLCGEPSRDNAYSTYNIYCVFGKLYYTLVGTYFTEEAFEVKMRRVIARHTSELMMHTRGVDKQKMLYLFVLDKIAGKKKDIYNVYSDE